MNQQPSGRREFLLGTGISLTLAASAATPFVAAANDGPSITLVSEKEGFGTAGADMGSFVLIHYVGYLGDSDTVFDSTRGGLMYRDGGEGVFRPAIVRLALDPVPGITAGLKQGLVGMRIGGKRTFTVPPELGFRDRTVLAPYAVVPPNSTLRYEVELIRLSKRGPDELTKGISRCGQGGAAQATDNCTAIEPLEAV